MSQPPLKVLIVSPDRSLLRILSRLLGALGYQVEPAAGEAEVRAALAGPLAPLILLDASAQRQESLTLCRELNGHLQRDLSVVLLIDRMRSADDVRQALEAGADDVLAHPVVYCELLGRLRAAARTLQWLERADQQGLRDSQSGLPNRAAFLHDLWKSGPARAGGKQAACVLLELDGFERLDRQHGRPAACQLARDFGDWLAEHCRDGSAPAALGGGRFGVWRAGPLAGTVDDWGAQIRAGLAAEEFLVAGKHLRLTASIGVANCANPRTDAARTMEHAEEALQLAVQSGRDHLVRYEEVMAQDLAWAELASWPP